MKFIALGLVGPSEAHWLTTDHRARVRGYNRDVTVSGYFCLMRPYPDSIDRAIQEILKPRQKLLCAAESVSGPNL